MPIVSLSSINENKIVNIPFTPGRSLKEIVNATEYGVQTGCLGNGACGMCRVRIEKGNVNPLSEIEQFHFSDLPENHNIRLSCQVFPESDIEIIIINPIPKVKWRYMSESEESCMVSIANCLVNQTGECVEKKNHCCYDVTSPENCANCNKYLKELYHSDIDDRTSCDTLIEKCSFPLGLAIDIGTTFLNFSIFNLKTKTRISSRIGHNPQAKFGSDVITRLTHAVKHPAMLNEMNSLLINAIRDVIIDFSNRDGLMANQIVKVVLAGNTPMLSILSKRNYDLLLKPEYWMKYIDTVPSDDNELIRIWGIHPEGVIEVIPPIAGFVGSDLIAGILASRLIVRPPYSLFIDFGTNSEIALWDGKTIWVTSAAGGPAFEGSGITYGVHAVTGAIYRAYLSDDHSIRYAVINSEQPIGICGSGLIDILSLLIQTKKLTETGNFTNDADKQRGMFLCKGKNDMDIILTKKDIDVVQKAKAAIGSGISVVSAMAGITPSDIRNIFVSGAFGQHLTVMNAQKIGLLPAINPQNIRLCGNTSLAGSGILVLNPRAKTMLKSISDKIKMVNLSMSDQFEELFLENLFIRPIQ
ncbi:MAG: DUF4445 domain-containing protein [Desulfobacterales bacterium]|nr:DUF4445 domain-containing protein [Desulfobacterales bacterium]